MHAPVTGEVLCFIRRHGSAPASGSEFNSLALRLFAFQFEKNVLYRRFCQMEGVLPSTLKDWKEIPAMPAAAFKELVLTTFSSRKKKRVFRTSGTTFREVQGGAAIRGAHYYETLAVYDASILKPFQKQVLLGGVFAFYFLMPSAADAPDSSLSYMMDVVNRVFARGRGRFYVRKGKPDFAAMLQDLIKERRKVLILSTAFALKGFLDHLEEKNAFLKLKLGSRLMETGGFKGRTHEIPKKTLYRLCAKRLGIPVKNCVSEYGMTELSSQYYSTGGGSFTAPAWMRPMVIDPRTGKECAHGHTGLLKHVDLANVGSVMAVQTEDVGRMRGKGFEVLGRALGSEARGCSLTYERFLRSSG